MSTETTETAAPRAIVRVVVAGSKNVASTSNAIEIDAARSFVGPFPSTP